MTGPAPFSVVVVTYHSTVAAADELRQLAVVARRRPELEWWVCDNSEGGEDADALAGVLPAHVRVERDPANPGFAAAVNAAARDATRRWLVLVNPDVWLDDRLLGDVLDAVQRHPGGAGSFAVGQVTHGVRHLGIEMLAGVWFNDRRTTSTRPLVGPSGGFAVYDRAAFLAVGGFDERLFAWGEDADLALRLRAAGLPCVAVPVHFPHAGGHSLRDLPDLRRRKVYLLARNRQVVAARHLSAPRQAVFQLMNVAVFAARLPRHLAWGTTGAFWRGVRDGVAAAHTAAPSTAGERSGG